MGFLSQTVRKLLAGIPSDVIRRADAPTRGITSDNSNLSPGQGGVNTGIAGANVGNDLNAYPDQAPLPTYNLGGNYQTGENLSSTVNLPEVTQPTGGYNPEGGYNASTLLDQYKQSATYNIGQTTAGDGSITGTGFTVPKIGRPGYETTTPALRDPSFIHAEQGVTPGYTQDQYGRFNTLSSLYNDQLAMMTGTRGVRDEELATLMSGQDLPTYGPTLPASIFQRKSLQKSDTTTDETTAPSRTELDAAMELSAFYNSMPEYERPQLSPSESRDLLNRFMQGEALEDLITPVEFTPLSETDVDPALVENITNAVPGSLGWGNGGSSTNSALDPALVVDNAVNTVNGITQRLFAKGGEVSLPDFLKHNKYGI